MTPHEEIKEWLDVPDQEKDFQKGFDLLTKYSRNRCMINMVGRKKDMPLLVYQVDKLMLVPVEAFGVKITSDIARNISEDLKAQKSEHFKQLEFERINRNELPPDHQAVYDGIAEAYKVQRVYHEKMKLATTDEERGEFRLEVIQADELIAAGWNGLDAFVRSGEKVPAAAKVDTVLGLSKDINASRSYVSRGINDLAKLEGEKHTARIAEIKKRIARLIELKAPVKSKTRKSLVELGIINEKSDLVGE